MIREEQDSIVTISQKPRGGTGEIIGKQLLTEADMQNNLNGLYINEQFPYQSNQRSLCKRTS